MTCAAIIAIKTVPTAKSRLRPALAAAHHTELVQTMLRRVIAAANGAVGIAEVLLVSPEQRESPPWPRTLHDSADDLNAAFEIGIGGARDAGHDSVLLLPGDLARVDAAAVDDFIRVGRQSGAAIATDRSGTGTNALWFSLDRPMRLTFGAGSCALHLAQFERIGLSATVVHDIKLSLDIDNAADLEHLRGHPGYEFLTASQRSVA